MAKTRSSLDFIPAWFRTDSNSKFFDGTVDQLIQKPELKKIEGFIGSKNVKQYDPNTDQYLNNDNSVRTSYELEPSIVLRDPTTNQVTEFTSYTDLLGAIDLFGGDSSDQSDLWAQQSYSFDPRINLDKFTNFREYVWAPYGVDPIAITGAQVVNTSTYKVVQQYDSVLDTNLWVFSPDGISTNPILTLIRGKTYIFEINSPGHPFYIKTTRSSGAINQYTTGVQGNGTDVGHVTITCDDNTPSTLYYVDGTDGTVFGKLLVRQQATTEVFDVEKELLGKKTYRLETGHEISNGMRLHFTGNIIPTSYLDKNFIVTGVGTSIQLIDFDDLKTPELYAQSSNVNFDNVGFDNIPFDTASKSPLTPEYITISNASRDKNPWSRYNRWVHNQIILDIADINKVEPNYTNMVKAVRPIIEFNPHIKLHNFGTRSIGAVQFVDSTVTNAFLQVEGKPGYYIDQTELQAGDRVIFIADEDPLVKNKVFQVGFRKINNLNQIALDLVVDTPVYADTTFCTSGKTLVGKSFWFDGSSWIESQQKTKLNQFPKFDIFDVERNSYSDSTAYPLTDFTGSTVFQYSIGTIVDQVLPFLLRYRTVENIGDIVFDIPMFTDSFTFVLDGSQTTLPLTSGYLWDYGSDTLVKLWTRTESKTYQNIIEQIDAVDGSIAVTFKAVDGRTNSSTFKIYRGGELLDASAYYITADETNNEFTVNLLTTVKGTEAIRLEVHSPYPKIQGYGQYSMPLNMTNNPLNQDLHDINNTDVSRLTLSELTNHTVSMMQNHPDFKGSYLGPNNLRDISEYTGYGQRLLQHEGLAIAGYFIANKEFNIIKTLQWAARSYQQYKLTLLDQFYRLNGWSTVSEALDIILSKISILNTVDAPWFYSDMIAYGVPSSVVSITASAQSKRYSYGTTVYDLQSLSVKSILVYLNGEQLIVGKDYNFDIGTPTITFTDSLMNTDKIEIKVYNSTNKSCMPATPSKLGMYPKYKPEIYTDKNYQTPTNVIRGHDGSITVAYGDARDEFLLELEKRIYNNIKYGYDTYVFDINSVIPRGFSRSEKTNVFDNILSTEFYNFANTYSVDYSTNDYETADKPFTFNYSGAICDVTGGPIPGYWRGMYKYLYDTDVPNIKPWEMLGFEDMPSWWESEYGPAPYTSGNAHLWQDLEAGVIRQGDLAGVNPVYARPGLTSIIPVDSHGTLLDPISANIVKTFKPILNAKPYKFGDQGPAETAWRKSSLYPYAVMIAASLINPAETLTKTFDPNRTVRDSSGYVIWPGSISGRFNPFNFFVHTEVVNGGLFYATGSNHLLIEHTRLLHKDPVAYFYNKFASFNVNLTYRAGGFISKSQFNVEIETANNYLSAGSVFLPKENYQIVISSSLPLQTISLSGMIFEKTTAGIKLRGYDTNKPYFDVMLPIHSGSDRAISIGGVSEGFLNWAPGQYISAGTLLEYNSKYYRAKTDLTTTAGFDPDFWYALPSLPTRGGASANISNTYVSNVTRYPYGTIVQNIQEAVDIILGYGKYLENQGFVFDYVLDDLGHASNYELSAKEFLFWTLQNWADNTIISLAPFSSQIKLNCNKSVADNFTDPFYDYSLLKSNGTVIKPNQISISRTNGQLIINTDNLDNDGIYLARINLIQKESAVVFDNNTLFNDLIYDDSTGYRQERLKVIGFITDNWDGDLFVPGFIYDPAQLSPWQSQTDYHIGDVVEIHGRYYQALSNILASNDFDVTKWKQLSDKPVAQILPNFEYKISQFEDFYSLDTANFDEQQQLLAQRLIGYTPRNYLSVIVPSPVSQYKFYTGYIREKGTVAPLEKLNITSNPTLGNHIVVGEDWAIRVGLFGGVNSSDELEFIVDSSRLTTDPSAFQLPVPESTEFSTDSSGYQLSNIDMISMHKIDTGAVLPVCKIDKEQGLTSSLYQTFPTAGYVRLDDVTFTAVNEANLLSTASVKALQEGDTTWIAVAKNGQWDVKRYTFNPATIINYTVDNTNLLITFVTNLPHNMPLRTFITVQNTGDTSVDGVYEILNIVNPYSFVVQTKVQNLPDPAPPISARLFYYSSNRFKTFDDVSGVKGIARWNNCEYVWVDDDGTGRWAVYEKEDNLTPTTLPAYQLISEQRFGDNIVVGATSKNLFVTSSLDEGGSIHIYNRQDDGSFDIIQTVYLTENIGEVVSDQTISGGTQPYQFGISSSVWEKDVSYVQAKITVKGNLATSKVVVFNATGIIVGMTASHPAIPVPFPVGTRVTAVEGNTITLSTRMIADIPVGDLVTFNLDRVRYLAAGAPYLSKGHYVADTYNTFRKILSASPEVSGTTLASEGAAKIFVYDPVTLTYTSDMAFASPIPQQNANFGKQIFITGLYSPVAFVSAPGQSGGGAVFVMTRDYLINSNYNWQFKLTNAGQSPYNLRAVGSVQFTNNAHYGEGLAGSVNGEYIFVGAPNQQPDPSSQYLGAVYVYKKLSSDYGYSLFQTITADSVVDSSKINLLTVSKNYTQSSTFVFSVDTNTLTRVTGNFISDGWRVGQQITFAGTQSNNKTFTINSLSINQLGFSSSTVAVNETITAAFTAKGAGLLKSVDFGSTISCSDDGSSLLIGSDHVSATRLDAGAVYNFKLVNNRFVLEQVVESPDVKNGELFGSKVSISADGNTAMISAIGGDSFYGVTFDTYTSRATNSLITYGSKYVLDPKAELRTLRTIFDRGASRFVSEIAQSGAVYLYEKRLTKFVYADKMISYGLSKNDEFGASIFNAGDAYYVGSPSKDYKSALGLTLANVGAITVFDKINEASWGLVRHEGPMVDSTKLEKSFLYDASTYKIIDQFEIFDPVKGVIPKSVKSEIKYMTGYDPATYTIAANIDSKHRVDSRTTWGPEHVGELWLDLSTLRYVWYDQGDIDFRNKNWGQLFPGSSVDVYEWVESDYTPADWSSLADTARGLASGISGQPKAADNSVVSLLQIYDPISNDFINRYYFWVKNKITLPNVSFRSISAYDCSALLTSPKNQGLKFVAPLTPISVGITNIAGTLHGKNNVFHLSYSTMDNRKNIHSKWQLVNELDERLKVDSTIVDKMIDSYAGIDSNANSVPDKNLSFKNRYGNLTTPNQTWFMSQANAMLDLTKFVNRVFSYDSFVGKISFSSIEKKDLPPVQEQGEWDIKLSNLDSLKTSTLLSYKTAKLLPTLVNGRVTGCTILESGYGYKNPPEVELLDPTGTGARISTILDNFGQVVGIKIITQGSNYSEPTATVRPFAVLVDYDQEVGVWSIQHFDVDKKEFYRFKSQKYDLTKYWDYVDWYSADFIGDHAIQYTVASMLEVKLLLNLTKGDYVLVKNEGDGRAIILRYDGLDAGNYLNDYSLVYRERGTVQILETLANDLLITSNYDSVLNFDVASYDSQPLTEIRILLTALRDSIFVDSYAVYFKELFFNAIRYLMQEQNYTDWIYKTSFIKPYISAGPLAQQKVYRYTDYGFVEQFIEEIKPYRSKIRDFTTVYDNIDTAVVNMTDFDFPSQYVDRTFSFPTDSSVISTKAPWRYWNDNHLFGITDILIASGGSGYTVPPQVIIASQPGDTGTGATATAYISGGKVTRVVVNSAGKNYRLNPRVILVGGGNYDNLVPARLSAVLGNSPVRNSHISLMFDRYDYNGLFTGENLVDIRQSDGQTLKYILLYPALQDLSTISVLLNGGQLSNDAYSVDFTPDGKTTISFNSAPPINYNIQIKYIRNGLSNVDTFVQSSTGAIKDTFNLTFPPTLDKAGIVVLIDQQVVVSSDYQIILERFTKTKTYTAKIRFSSTPPAGSTIEVNYFKAIDIINSIDRIKNYYRPGPGMPGRDPAQVIKGLEFGGVEIQGLDLSVSVGWDGLPWQSNSWDNSLSSDFLVRGDGTTTSYDLGYIPVLDTEYNVYFDNVRVDDPNFGTPAALSSALFKTIKTDGVSSSIILPVVPITDTLIIIRKTTSDGVLLPSDEITLDSEISGGSFALTTIAGQSIYKTANGLLPNDINVDGGSFLDTAFGHAPEELIKGGMFDHLSMSVFSSPSIGSNEVTTLTLRGDGTTTRFELTHTPVSLNQIDVYVGNSVKTKYDPAHPDYPYDYNIQQVEGRWYINFTVAPADQITVIVQLFSIGGHQILDKQTYTITNSDISTGVITITSAVSYNDISNFYLSFAGTVLADYDSTNSAITLSKATDSSRAVITVTLSELTVLNLAAYQTTLLDARAQKTYNEGILPALTATLDRLQSQFSSLQTQFSQTSPTISTGNGIQPNPVWYALQAQISSLGGQISSLESQILNANGLIDSAISTISSVLSTLGPYEAGNTIYVVYFREPIKTYSEVYHQNILVLSNTDTYTLTRPPGTIAPLHSMAIVTKGGQRLRPVDTEYYTVGVIGQSFALGATVSYALQSLDISQIEVCVNGIAMTVIKDWIFESSTNTVTLNSLSANVGDAVAISILSGADFLIYENYIKFNASANINTGDHVTVITYTNQNLNLMHRVNYTGISTKAITLDRFVKNENYVWVDVNKTPLLPIFDYRVTNNGTTVEFQPTVSFTTTDIITVTTISSDVSKDSIAYRQTKNVFQVDQYFRLGRTESVTLTQPLLPTDDTIYLSSTAPLKTGSSSQSGTLMIAGEKILYRQITDTGVSNLIRGIEGTGIRQSYITGTKVFSINNPQTIPYSDGRIQQTVYTTNRTSVKVALAIGGTLTRSVVVDSAVNLFAGMYTTYEVQISDTITIPNVNYIDSIVGNTVILRDSVSNFAIGKPLTFVSTTNTVNAIKLSSDFKLSNDSDNEKRVQVFVGGRALRKPTLANNPITAHNFSITLNNGDVDSQGNTGDIVLSPEYTITYDSIAQCYYVNILQTALPKNTDNTPIVGVEIKVLQNIGRLWYTPGTTSTLQADVTTQAAFLQTSAAEVPDKYYYGK